MSGSKFSRYISRKIREYGDDFDSSDLAPQFIKYFNSGERIKVDYGGKIVTGTVGITTGWRPTFLLMRKETDIDSEYLLREDDKVIAVRRKVYVNV